MSKVQDFLDALALYGDGRLHYWNGSDGVGCSDYVRMALRRANIITDSENNSNYLWAIKGYRSVLKDTTRFKEHPASEIPKDGWIMWFDMHHVSVYDSNNGANPYGLHEAAPESTHGICSNGKTGVGYWKSHNYNCSGGNLTCYYEILEDNNMSSIDAYMKRAEEIANDDAHGYSNKVGSNLGTDFGQSEYDCGGFVSDCLRHAGMIGSGVVFEPNSPTGTWGYDVILTDAGFKQIAFNKSSVKRGDVLIRDGKHTELCYDSNHTIGSHYNYDGKNGDSQGNEISVVDMSSNWTYMYRLVSESTGHSELSYGSTGEEVKELQTLLNKHGAALAVDGSFGNLTKQAVIDFQTAHELVVDGVVGSQTWAKLEEEATYIELEPADLLAVASDATNGKYVSEVDHHKYKLTEIYGEAQMKKIQKLINLAHE